MADTIIVIGGGPGGYIAALRAASLGGNVTLIEKENLGGTCLNWGCIPSKIMKHSADLFLKFQKADQLGITHTGDISFNMVSLMERKNKILDTQRKGIESLLRNQKVSIIKGTGKIQAHGMVRVDDGSGVPMDIHYDKLIIASGTVPLDVPDFPFDHDNILSSNDVLEINSIPDSILIAGGGVIGCEFAFIFAALGSQVTIVEAMSRILPLPSVDEACSKLLLKEMKKKKIKVMTDTVVTGTELSGNTINIHLDDSPFTDNRNPKKLGPRKIQTSKLAVCIGRKPLSSELGLDTIQVKTDRRGWIQANEFMETSVKDVYAIGDILGPSKVMLAHVASHEGIVAAENAMGGHRPMNYNVIPSAIFTMPEIGTAGISESEALEKGISYETFSVNFRSLGKAQAIDEIAGEVKMIVDKNDQTILGVHIIGPHATDIIAEAALAIQTKTTVEKLARTIHAHPTLSEIMGEVAFKAAGIQLHG